MEDSLRKFRDRLRIILILYTFCERLKSDPNGYFGVFKTEMKIQALDFLLRYPDFLCMELIDLMDSNSSISRKSIEAIIENIYRDEEPSIRAEEMEKFFHGAYESIDDVIAFLVSVGFVKHESKKRINGRTYEKTYYVTNECASKIDSTLKSIPSVKWYIDRCRLLKEYFSHFSGSELKDRQYRYGEYSNVSYKSHILQINDKVKQTFKERFQKELV